MRASEQLSSTNGQVPSIQGFVVSADGTDFELYPHQQQAIERLKAGDHVILSTPTGSGKSLVALVATRTMLNSNRRTAYTAPTKALVNEKFFGLVKALGADNVGLITGDAAVNTEAPVIACTAEILANQTLRMGADTPLDFVVMDEFHYYGDAERGWAWQVPLLQLTNTQFLLMSGTLGDVGKVTEDLAERTGRVVSVIETKDRPVPLSFSYRQTPTTVSIRSLQSRGLLPAYIVHFTQSNATEHARKLRSKFPDLLTKKTTAAINETIQDFAFSGEMGTQLKNCLSRGIGIHHAGMLPKYRLLVEQLAQQGHLKLICGTDTLGLGINVPIRTVLFTRLDKYDGKQNHLLTPREFQQIAGRAGRSGYDTQGYVWVQAPEHRFVPAHRQGKPQDLAIYTKNTMHKLWQTKPKTLVSKLQITPGMVLSLLSRADDGYAEMQRLIQDNHGPVNQKWLNEKAEALIKSLVKAKALARIDSQDDSNPKFKVNRNPHGDIVLDNPLSVFLLQTVQRLDINQPDYHWRTLLLVESVVEDPRQVLSTIQREARDRRAQQLKRDGEWWEIDYEERMWELDQAVPKPQYSKWLMKEYNHFLRNNNQGQWLGVSRPSPKNVCREIIQRKRSFKSYVNSQSLHVSEGVLLRYLVDCYKTLAQTLPAQAMTPKLQDCVDRLGNVISEVDSSLLDEWQTMRDYEQRSLCAPSPV